MATAPTVTLLRAICSRVRILTEKSEKFIHFIKYHQYGSLFNSLQFTWFIAIYWNHMKNNLYVCAGVCLTKGPYNMYIRIQVWGLSLGSQGNSSYLILARALIFLNINSSKHIKNYCEN